MTEIIVFVNIFAKIWNFVKIRFLNVVMSWPSWLSRPLCPVQVTCQASLSSPRCPTVLSQLSGPRCPLSDAQSCPGCPVPLVLFQLPCPGNLVHSSPDATAISRQSCPLCPFQAHLSGWPVQTALSRLSCPAVLSEWSWPRYSFWTARMSHSACPVLAVLSLLSCFGRSVLFPTLAVLSPLSAQAAPSWLSRCGFPVLAVMFSQSCPLFPILNVLSRLSCLATLPRLACPAVLFWLSCPGCPVPAVLCYLSCSFTLVPSSPVSTSPVPSSPIPTSPIPTAWSLLSCSGSPVLSVLPRHTCSGWNFTLNFQTHLSRLTCPDCPVLAVLSQKHCS